MLELAPTANVTFVAEPLSGAEFRIFRSLIEEWPEDTVEKLRVEMTRGVELSPAEIERALRDLTEKGYVEEFEPGRWQVTASGHGRKRTLLGERRQEALEELAEFAMGSEEPGVKQVRYRLEERLDGEPVTRLLLLVDDPRGPTWDLDAVSDLRKRLGKRATELGLPAVSISLVPESERDAADVG
jgi:DNA-binding transcriptional ArsR family regulator